ncbi:BA14K family protein [Ensifer adhaerens]|uniref:BA14K family protein n=1 Tax=Ensifer adhaerens TaxID=106592 RepID=UPI0023A9246C|nr:BA14K family protein [Ensifer adhaerens]WDZ77650.1 BA14K family protein [Ensifer adhaerens]
MKTLSIIALSLAAAMSSVPPANAFPVVPQVSRTTDIQKAQFPYERGEARKNRSSCAVPYCEFGGRHGYYRDRDRRGYYRDGYYRDGYYRDRYRRHYGNYDNDVGAFIGGLAAGAIVGGLLNQPRYYNGPRAVSGDAHTRWCYARYRSYRAWDNSYQPYGGPRRQCNSPY